MIRPIEDRDNLLAGNVVKWMNVSDAFIPRKTIPDYREPNINVDQKFRENYNEMDVFMKLFPRSLILWIVQCTNERLQILSDRKGKEVKPTNYHEMMVVICVYFIMSYNRVPDMQMYWCSNLSLRNEAIAKAIPRDRFLMLSSKLYFNSPKKPQGAGKTYYMDEVMNCLKKTFQSTRSDSTYQNIDESMIKCKARTAIRQRVKIKPVRDGIKMWGRCDAKTGYTYDMNIYIGKELEKRAGTLGERVVQSGHLKAELQFFSYRI